MRLIDLTQPITSGMPVYPGDPAVTISSALTVEADGVAVTRLDLGSHTGTHIDAPAHSISGGSTVDELPLTLLIGQAAVLHCTATTGPTITHADLVGGVPDTLPEIVCIATGWDRHFGSVQMESHPGLSIALVEMLWARGARVLGVDMLSPDPTRPSSGAALEVHEYWLGRGGVIVENLTSLTTLPGSVEISLLPLNIRGIDGSPVRAVAKLADTEARPA
ncbi:cyclase family protein [Leucobacter tardus]|uniref:Cyclase family protein n=1 Tax=Leucobacter tardus TaxID=501483 RepID=A0A939QFD8_9MICO|nr:cyclase family protein [Leucobacter tardus]MBO2990916.1 cyclase family protein [Leucobacter tardus]